MRTLATLLLLSACSSIGRWQEERALRDQRDAFAALQADIAAPRVDGGAPPGEALLALALDTTGLWADDSAWVLQLDPELRAELPGAVAESHRGLPGPGALPGLHPPLLGWMQARMALRRQVAARQEAWLGEEPFALWADGALPFGAVAGALYTAGQAGWSRAELGVRGGAGPAALLHEAPNICGHGEGGAPCALWSVSRDGGWRSERTRATDDGCVAVLPAGAPARGELPEDPADWSLEGMGAGAGDLPLCSYGFLVGDPAQPWREVAAAFARMRALGVEHVRLGVRAPSPTPP